MAVTLLHASSLPTLPAGFAARARGPLAAVACALLSTFAPAARADEPTKADAPVAAPIPLPHDAAPASGPPVGHASAPPDVSNWVLRRKHTQAEFEVGVIALPSAPISRSQQGGNLPLPFGTIGHGDATASLGLHILYRAGRDWAIGAGALFAPRPTSDTEYGGSTGLRRSHARSYLWLGGELRYIPIHLRTLEAWVGASVGGVVVADRFDTTTTPVPPDLGTSVVTVSTEGGSLGLQIGGEWAFAERLLLGLVLRYDQWVLPSGQPSCTPILDCATLHGPVTELELGLRLGYRIPL
jgi:hypothetical protein